jgi:hypothetical protein
MHTIPPNQPEVNIEPHIEAPGVPEILVEPSADTPPQEQA